MRKYLRHKTLDEIREQCAAQGLTLEESLHSRNSSDYVVVSSPKCPRARVLYSTFNGRFFGVDENGNDFNSGMKLDSERWFAGLLDFFYVQDLTPSFGD